MIGDPGGKRDLAIEVGFGCESEGTVSVQGQLACINRYNRSAWSVRIHLQHLIADNIIDVNRNRLSIRIGNAIKQSRWIARKAISDEQVILRKIGVIVDDFRIHDFRW